MGLVEDAELGWSDHERMAFIAENLVEALAPSNHPFTNPKVLKRIVDTGGGNLLAGGRRFVRDFAKAPRVPSMVEADAFEVGTDLALTEGTVVLRTEMFELIEYAPQTPQVHEVPLLIVPPTINKYYIIDLAEQRSLVEHLVQSGLTVYVHVVAEPRRTTRQLGPGRLRRRGPRGDGCLRADHPPGQDGPARHLLRRHDHLDADGAPRGHRRPRPGRGVQPMVTVLDQERAGTTNALLSHKAAAASTQARKEKGYLDGRTLAEIFAWLRPNDLIWNYWVNNYLMGRAPKAFDILFWNADPVRMTAAMHRDFIDLAMRNALVEPGESTMLGSKVDLSQVTTESYVVAGIADHLCKWESCYQTTQLLGGPSKFVLSTSGHIAAMVNPPGNPKANFRTNDENPTGTDAWLASASVVQGSWWADYAAWLGERCGPERNRPRKAGSSEYPPVCAAPGTYVHDR